jgi:hypothetical protein
MAESSNVDELEIKREEYGTKQQPNQDERHLQVSPEIDREKYHLHDGIGQRFHHRVNLLIDCRRGGRR